ncbi:MAG: polysaccharide biosynthesis tyrosine autokinase [Cyanobacteria bacterium J06623_7]
MSNEKIKPQAVDLSALNPASNSEAGFSFAELKQVVYRRWKPAMAVGIASFTGIFLITALQTPKYRSESLILLESPQNQESTSIAPSIPGSQYYTLKDLSTEIFVLRSNSMVNQAIEELKQRYPELKLKKVLKNLAIHQAIVNKVPTDVLSVSYTDTDPEKAKVVLETLGNTYINYSLQREKQKAANAIAFIDRQLPEAQAELDSAAQEIRQFRQANQLVDPELSAVEAEGLQKHVAEQIEQTKIAIALTQNQLQELNRQLGDLGQDSDTMVASSVLSQDGVYQDLATQLKDVETQYNLGKVDFTDEYHVLANLKDKRGELKKLLQERAEQVLGQSVSPKVLQRIVLAPSYTDTPLEGDIGANSDPDSESQSSGGNTAQNPSSSGVISSRLGVDNPSRNAAGTQVSSEGSTLEILASRKLELQNQAASLQGQLNTLMQSQAEANDKFLNIPGLQQTFMELKRQLDLKSQAYNYLLERRQELAISAAEEIAPWRILNEAFLPSKPVSPNIKQGLIQALVAGGFLGVAIAFILQQLDRTVKQVDEVKQITQLPLLGVVPRVTEPSIMGNIHTTKQAYSYYSSYTEGLRSLAMNLRYLVANDRQIKTLAVTSSTSAEGKSTISHNLGIVLAEFDLRVLIVDADLRKPKLHKLAQIDNNLGLSEIISQSQAWSACIQPGAVDNLDLIPAGATSPNPIALLNSQRMKQLVAEWSAAYDYVIIDTPPIGVIADAKSLAQEVDSMLFVTAIERATRKAISNSVEILQNSQCHIAGVVANMVDPELDYYAYSYHDSYYNQPGESRPSSSTQPKGKKGLLEQFRRR